MRSFRSALGAAILAAISALSFGALSPLAAQVPCGGTFSSFLKAVATEAQQRGFSQDEIRRFLASAVQDPEVLRADRAQGIFQRPFVDFSRRLISQNRIDAGQRNAQKWDSVFDRIERDYGVNRGVLLAFWAFETDFGAVQGNFNTVNALLTLSHDCRRPDLFLPQVFAAMELAKNGAIDPARTTGAWAGEIGMVQMLPQDIIDYGTDGDGDGQVSLKSSPPDALISGARMLQGLGWRPNEPWLIEINVPSNLDWSLTGLETKKSVSEWQKLGISARNGSLSALDLEASVVLPQGHTGPAFLAYPNFDVYFEWNQSFVYVTTAAYFATRLEGAPVFDATQAPAGLGQGEMKSLQQKLTDRGYDVGGIDGILGAKTRAAVQAEQVRLGLPADAWPTKGLLERL